MMGILCVVMGICLVVCAATETPHLTDGHCTFMEFSNSIMYKGVMGTYELKDSDLYSCNNRTVYQQSGAANYLYYVIVTGWSGWMIGDHECKSKGFISVGDDAEYPDGINSTWEEYNGIRWIYNEDVISGCHIAGVTRPPRWGHKTKAPKNATIDATTEKNINREEDLMNMWGSNTNMTLYLFVPIGCAVIIILIIILGSLSITHKSFMKKYEAAMIRKVRRRTTSEQVGYDNRSSRVSVMSDIEEVVGVPGDQDSVYEVLSEPEDATTHQHGNGSVVTVPKRHREEGDVSANHAPSSCDMTSIRDDDEHDAVVHQPAVISEIGSSAADDRAVLVNNVS